MGSWTVLVIKNVYDSRLFLLSVQGRSLAPLEMVWSNLIVFLCLFAQLSQRKLDWLLSCVYVERERERERKWGDERTWCGANTHTHTMNTYYSRDVYMCVPHTHTLSHWPWNEQFRLCYCCCPMQFSVQRKEGQAIQVLKPKPIGPLGDEKRLFFAAAANHHPHSPRWRKKDVLPSGKRIQIKHLSSFYHNARFVHTILESSFRLHHSFIIDCTFSRAKEQSKFCECFSCDKVRYCHPNFHTRFALLFQNEAAAAAATAKKNSASGTKTKEGNFLSQKSPLVLRVRFPLRGKKKPLLKWSLFKTQQKLVKMCKFPACKWKKWGNRGTKFNHVVRADEIRFHNFIRAEFWIERDAFHRRCLWKKSF